MRNRFSTRIGIGASPAAAGLALALAITAGVASAQQPPDGFKGPPPGGIQGPPPGAAPGGAPADGVPTAGAFALPKPPGPNAPKPNKNPRDFEGVFVGVPANGGVLFGPLDAVLTPKGQARVGRRVAMLMNNLSPEAPSNTCRPFGNIFNVAQPIFPVTILQTPKRVVLLTEEGRGVWEIFLDRGHPTEVTPTYNGHSVGRWEGDTLAVDVVGYNGKQWLDYVSGPNSAKTRVSVRIRKLIDSGRLEFNVAIEDPEIFVGPRKATYQLDWNPDLKMHEFDCESSFGVGTFPGILKDTDEAPAKLPAGAVIPPPGVTGLSGPPGASAPPPGAPNPPTR